MDLHEWLDQPENKGRAAWLAEQLNRSKTAVSLWREEGIPLQLIPKIASLTFGSVTEAEMLRHTMACKLAKSEKAA